jgi:hypothetical protein
VPSTADPGRRPRNREPREAEGRRPWSMMVKSRQPAGRAAESPRAARWGHAPNGAAVSASGGPLAPGRYAAGAAGRLRFVGGCAGYAACRRSALRVEQTPLP